MAAPEYGARNYGGATVPTTLAVDITGGSASMTVADGSSYPATAFFITIDPGLATEEKIYVASRSGNLFSGLERSEDDTVAQAHTAGAVIVHGWVAQDAREANAMSSVLAHRGSLITRSTATGPQELVAGTDGLPLVPDQTTALGLKYAPLALTVGLAPFVNGKGALLAGGTAGAPTEVAAGAVNRALVADPAQPAGMSWTDIGLGAWADWVPVFTQGVTPAQNYSIARWVKIGRTVMAIVQVNFTSAGTSGSVINMTLPTTAGNLQMVGGNIAYFDNGFGMRGAMVQASTTTVISFAPATETVVGTNLGQQPAFAIASGDSAHVFLTMEAAA